MPRRVIEAIKAPIRRHWPRLRLRTILLLTFVFVAALPGFGALFLRVYENTLVRQTEAELIAQGTALSAVASADWPGSQGISIISSTGQAYDPYGVAGGDLSTIDLRSSPVLPERPPTTAMPGAATPVELIAARRIGPLLQATARTTLASILLLNPKGRLLTGPEAGRSYPFLPELAAASTGKAVTVLRRNSSYRPHYRLEWLSRASDLRIHHARPVIVNGRIVAVLLLSRSPRALFRGLYEDWGKILLGAAAIFATLVVLSGLLSRGIARPIELLSDTARGLARGAGSVPPPPPTAAIEIQALYADLAIMADAIERRSRYLRDFAHAVSHEFKTPLSGIRGVLELLADHPEMGPADRSRFLSNADADVARLTLLVSRLLELARADMAKTDGHVSEAVLPVVSQVADAHRRAGFDIEVIVPEALPPIAVPAATLEAVLATLLENSYQAGARSARIEASVSVFSIRLVMSDNGPGVAAADRLRLFEPFFTTRRAEGGTGLGLAIARSLLSAVGATIGLGPSATANFVMDLPRADVSVTQ